MSETMQAFRVRLFLALLLLLLTKFFLGLGVADQLAATGPAPLISIDGSASSQ